MDDSSCHVQGKLREGGLQSLYQVVHLQNFTHSDNNLMVASQ